MDNMIYRRNAFGRQELLCPGCGEALQSVDVEFFPHCPFCNCKLASDAKFEDFILDPVISHWIGKNSSSHF